MRLWSRERPKIVLTYPLVDYVIWRLVALGFLIVVAVFALAFLGDVVLYLFRIRL